MKGIALSILITMLTAAFLQPLIETANVLKEKIALETAVLNSCRAAKNNSLLEVVSDDNYGISDLDAYISVERFKAHFARAFADTLNLDETIYSSHMSFTSPSNRWNQINVWVSLDDYDSGGRFEGRSVSKIIVRLETNYVFRTNLLQAAVGDGGNSYKITIERPILVQIIN